MSLSVYLKHERNKAFYWQVDRSNIDFRDYRGFVIYAFHHIASNNRRYIIKQVVEYIFYTFIISLAVIMISSFRSTPKEQRKNGRIMLESMLSDIFLSALIAFLLGSIIYAGVKTFSEGITFGSYSDKDNITLVSGERQIGGCGIY